MVSPFATLRINSVNPSRCMAQYIAMRSFTSFKMTVFS